MKLSIILPVFNMEKYLHRSIHSLLAQDIPKDEYEIIIVNDESKDKSLAIARELEAAHENVIVCDKKNGGAGAARNSGLDLAKGKYIHFVDPDDYVAENIYKTLVECAERNQLDLLAFDIIKTTDTNLYQTKSIMEELDCNQLQVEDGITYIAHTNYNSACWWYLLNREFLTKTGLRFIEGRWMEDSILTPKLFIKAKRVAKIPLDVYRYMVIPNSAMTSTEPTHYQKLIHDIENATFVFDDILKTIPENGENHIKCKNRIKTRQQSFVFYLLVRLMKSGLPTKYIPKMLYEFKKINAYPLTNFIGEDFNSLGHSFLTFIFNREKLMYPFMHLFRFFYSPYLRLISK